MADGVNKAVGRALAAMRKSKDMTQEDVAEALGTVPITVSRWERGATSPGLDDVTNYAYVCGETPSEVFASALSTKRAAEAVVPRSVKDRARRLERKINDRHFGGKED